MTSPPPKTTEDSAKAAADAKPASPAGRDGLVGDPREYPRGITVLIEGWEDPLRAGAYPQGVTVLAPPDVARKATDRPLVRVVVPFAPQPSPADADQNEATEPTGQDLLRSPADAAREELATPPEDRTRTTVGNP